MFALILSLGKLLVTGDNTNKELGFARPSNIATLEEVTNSVDKYDKVSLGEEGAYLITNGRTYITGNSFVLEGETVPTNPYAESPYLSSFNIVDVSTSNDHAIALQDNGIVHTIGKNDNRELGRITSQSYSTGIAQPPIWYEEVIGVGAVKSLSYIVYPSAIFVIGKCESCLCGNDIEGNQIKTVETTWLELNLSTIDNIDIKRVHFGEEQIVIEMYDNRFYYIGKTEYGAGCANQESFCTPRLLPFTNAKALFISAKVTAIITLNNEIKYCGCENPESCTNNSELTELNTLEGRTLFKLAEVNEKWYVIEENNVYYLVFNENTITSRIMVKPFGAATQSALVGFNNSLITFQLYRYLNVSVTGNNLQVNVTVCGLNLEQRTTPFNYNNDLIGSAFEYGSNCVITIESPNTYRIYDSFVLEDVRISKTYNVIEYPYQGVNSLNLNLLFEFANGTSIINDFDIKIVPLSQNNTLILTQESVNRYTTLEIPLNATALYDTYNISITTETEPPEYYNRYFRYEITEPNARVNVVLVPIEEKYFLIIDESTQTPIPGVIIEFYYENHSFRNNETSNSTGYITLKKKETDPPGYGFNILYKYTSNGTYSDINYTYIWITFDVSTTNITLSPTGSFITVSVTYGRGGEVWLESSAGTKLTTITFPTSGNQYTQEVRIDPAWNEQGEEVTGIYIDPRNTYFAYPIIQVLQNGSEFNFEVFPTLMVVSFLVVDENNNPVPSHVITISIDNMTTNETYTTNITGEVDVSIYEPNIIGGQIWIWVDAADGYDSFPETAIPTSSLQQREVINLYKFVTFNISVNVVEGVVGEELEGIYVTIADSNAPSAILLSGTTNGQGHIEFITQETANVISFGENYIVEATDLNGEFVEISKNIYISTPTIELDIRMAADKIKFEVIDTETNEVAQGAQVNIYIESEETSAVSDANGMITVDVSGSFRENRLFYEILRTYIYKPSSRQRFAYSVGLITLNAESWLNMTLKLTLVDGITNSPLDNMNVSIFTETGTLQYNQITTQTGILWLNFSERDNIIELNTVYNMSIDDILERYSVYNVNFSVSSSDEETLIPMNLQRLLIIITNFDAERVGNVTIDLYSDGELIETQKTNALGITIFYLKENQYEHKELTYYVHESRKYRPISMTRIEIKEEPEEIIRRVFPLIIYNYTFNLNESENEIIKINESLEEPSFQSETYVENQEFSVNNDGAPNLANITPLEVQFFNSDKRDTLNPMKLHSESIPEVNISILFYDSRKRKLYETCVYEIYNPITFLFVENINQTFTINHIYAYEVKDNTGFYETVEGKFRTLSLSEEFNVTLNKLESTSDTCLWWILPGAVALIMACSFVIYAAKRLKMMKKKFRSVEDGKTILFSSETYFTEEEAFIADETEKLNRLTREENGGHTIARHKLLGDTSDIEAHEKNHNFIENAQILLKAKLENVHFVH